MHDGLLSVAIAQATPVSLDVSFTCGPGDVLGIYGPSGSGKTTMLRTIAGLHRPPQGRVAVGSEVWLDTAMGQWRAPHRRRVGYVFQDYALFPHMTALDNIGTALIDRPSRERRARALELLDAVELTGKRDRRPAELSGGERQRVALARALARDPAVLLLDEPFSAVDRAVRGRLQDLVDTLRRRLNIPLVLVTHDFDDIVRLASHLVVLEHGRSVASGTVRDVTAQSDQLWMDTATGAGVVFDARVTHIDAHRGLAELAFDGGRLVASDGGLAVDGRVRVRIPARDVILASDVPPGLSLHNALAAVVTAVSRDHRRRHAVVQLAIGNERLLAEVTFDAVERLSIQSGRALYALIKSVSLRVLPVA